MYIYMSKHIAPVNSVCCHDYLKWIVYCNMSGRMTDLWVSRDPVYVTIEIAIRHLIGQRSWSRDREKYSIFGVSHDILYILTKYCRQNMYVTKVQPWMFIDKNLPRNGAIVTVWWDD
jgi:hypothetical protein